MKLWDRIIGSFRARHKEIEVEPNWVKYYRERREAVEHCRPLWEKENLVPPDINVLPQSVREEMVSLFIVDGYRLEMLVGGTIGINADVFVIRRSGSTKTLFYEQQQGTEQFIRMVRAAYAYENLLANIRQEMIQELVTRIKNQG